MPPTIIPGLEQLPTTLTQRIFHRNEFLLKDQKTTKKDDASFVLYLTTVNLRIEHNPGFALACHLANAFQVPLIVLAVVLDDTHLPKPANVSEEVSSAAKPIVFTARRIAFVLEALQQVTKEWEIHGAGVAIRVHGPQCRTPHHLTLARKATAVVTDEPFVHPYRRFVDTIQQACQYVKVPLFSVDGNTTVPPIAKLQKQTRDEQGRLRYLDCPNKAWRWEERTRPNRRGQVLGAVKDGHLDAPPLLHKLPANFFVVGMSNNNPNTSGATLLDSSILPDDWKNVETAAPGKRPWTVSELACIIPKQWVMTWPGIDTTVPPCLQTHGSARAGLERWNNFVDNHLRDYAKLRNQIIHPHAVSRMSCYLNYGVVSIFRVVNDVWDSKKGRGAGKFIDEVVKWREIGYVHAFSNPEYNVAAAVPSWASKWMSTQQQSTGSASTTGFSLEQLALGTTKDDKWNAMQHYLVETGELHNNARMTWGKTMLHWQRHHHNVEEVLYQMVYVNDRYALDGLSPPSYAGLLWCFGWCDKPSNKQGGISTKPASKYRVGSAAFGQARKTLLPATSSPPNVGTSATRPLSNEKQSPAESASAENQGEEEEEQQEHQHQQEQEGSPTKRLKSIDSYFKVAG